MRRSGSPAAAVRARSSTQFDFRPGGEQPDDHDSARGSGSQGRARRRSSRSGMDHELNRTMSVGVRYAHKWIDYAIEAVCNFTPSGEEDCGVNNPGYGSELGTYPLGRSNPGAAAGGARLRRHRGPAAQAAGEPLVGRRRAICTATCAATGRASPAPTRRSAGCSRTPAGRSTCSTTRTTRRATPTYGRLGTDRPHQFKAQAHLRLCPGARWSARTRSSRAACRSRRS